MSEDRDIAWHLSVWACAWTLAILWAVCVSALVAIGCWWGPVVPMWVGVFAVAVLSFVWLVAWSFGRDPRKDDGWSRASYQPKPPKGPAPNVGGLHNRRDLRPVVKKQRLDPFKGHSAPRREKSFAERFPHANGRGCLACMFPNHHVVGKPPQHTCLMSGADWMFKPSEVRP